MGRLAYHPLGPGNWPITSAWRPPHRPGHRGADIGCYKAPLLASISGVATRGDEPGGAGYWVNITSGPYTVKCFHMSRIYIANGQTVTAGQEIGRSGGVPGEPGAGNTGGAHLHFELWENGRDTDPVPDLNDVAGAPAPEPPTPPEEDEMTPEQEARVMERIDAAGEATRSWVSERLEQVAAADRVLLAGSVEAIVEAVIRVDEDDEEIVTRKRDELLAVVLPKLDALKEGN